MLAGLYSSVQTFNLSRDGQITDRFTKAIEQLGATVSGPDGNPKPKLEVRLGAIYALERRRRRSEITGPLSKYSLHTSDRIPLQKQRRFKRF